MVRAHAVHEGERKTGQGAQGVSWSTLIARPSGQGGAVLSTPSKRVEICQSLPPPPALENGVNPGTKAGGAADKQVRRAQGGRRVVEHLDWARRRSLLAPLPHDQR